MLEKITSDASISKIEATLKVSAGPGAGKTKWLINHIKNVLHHSRRLRITKKIACITYTNVAVETIIKRLGESADRVEVSTIHSFLYNHVVKPYLNFISVECDFNIQRLDGHNDPFVSTKILTNWIENHPNKTELVHPFSVNQLTKLPDNKEALYKWLASLTINLVSGDIKWTTDRRQAYHMADGKRLQINRKTLETLEKDLLGYKKLYWTKGILTHDDVLYFSFLLLQEFPFILNILRAKFPYLFCDEFQDINPIQNSILEKIGQVTTIIGIIGDKAQSIYSFQGAHPSQLDTFFPSNVDSYIIEDNWRSTDNIIKLLNHIRKDIQQRPKRRIIGSPTTIIVGEKLLAYQKAKECCSNEQLHCLARDNLTANTIRKGVNISIGVDLIEELYNKDSNPKRPKVIMHCIEAIEYGLQGYYKDALKTLYRLEIVHASKEPKKKALAILKLLLDEEPSLRDAPLLNTYEFINKQRIAGLARFSGSNPKSFYETKTFREVSTAIKNLNESDLSRTIHKSKGDEFDNVLLIFDKDSKGQFDDNIALDFIFSPDLGIEEQRIKYVAVSRARNRLFLSVPFLHSKNEAALAQLGFSIDRIV
jgi:DNA helicase II / ATP-dependent DNA helicase PcrA